MYQPYVVLNDKEFKVVTEDGLLFTQEEAMGYCDEMRKATWVGSLLTEDGIISYNVANIKSVYYLCKKVN